MSRTGKCKTAYVKIPHKLYAAILQDIESRERGISVEAVVLECIRERYASVKVKREYLVRAGSEVTSIRYGSGEAAALRVNTSFKSSYAVGEHQVIARPRGRPRKDASARRG